MLSNYVCSNYRYVLFLFVSYKIINPNNKSNVFYFHIILNVIVNSSQKMVDQSVIIIKDLKAYIMFS